jgi:hypothetical protein
MTDARTLGWAGGWAGLRQVCRLQGAGQDPGRPGSQRSAPALPVVGLMVVGLTLTISRPGYGQLIDQYLPPGIPGYDTDLEVTVESRLRPAYEPPGVRVGNFIIRPEATESFGYNDNVTGVSHGNAGSPELETQAAVTADSDWSIHGINAAVSIDDVRYFNQPSQNQTNWVASIGGHYDLGRDRINMVYTHSNLNQSPLNIDSFGILTPVPYQTDDVRLSYTTQFGRYTFTPNAEFTSYRFGSETANGTTISQSFRNRYVFQGGLTMRYELAEKRDVVVVLNGFDSDYTGAPLAGQPKRDSTGFDALAGLDYFWSGALRFRVLGGYEVREFSSSAFKTQSAPVAQASVIWTPTGLTTVTATATRAIEDSSDEFTVGYTLSTARIAVDHELYRNVILEATGGVQNADYAQNFGNQTIYTAGASATWLINRNLHLIGSYGFARSTATGQIAGATTAALSGGKYTQDIYLLSLHVAL